MVTVGAVQRVQSWLRALVSCRSVARSDWAGLTILGVASLGHGMLLLGHTDRLEIMQQAAWGASLVSAWQVGCLLVGVACLIGVACRRGLSILVAAVTALFTLWGLLHLIGWAIGHLVYGYAVAVPYLTIVTVTGWAYARGHSQRIAPPDPSSCARSGKAG